jgi:hypothetical protein
MKRTIGLLMMVGLMVGVVGCGDDDNPVKSYPVESYQDHLVGIWLDYGDSWNFKSDGTYVDVTEDGSLEGTWSLDGDQITITYSIETIRDFLRTLIAVEDEISVEDVSDEVVDERLADAYPDANDFVVLIYTLNSVTDTELTLTDDDGESGVLTRKN